MDQAGQSGVAKEPAHDPFAQGSQPDTEATAFAVPFTPLPSAACASCDSADAKADAKADAVKAFRGPICSQPRAVRGCAASFHSEVHKTCTQYGSLNSQVRAGEAADIAFPSNVHAARAFDSPNDDCRAEQHAFKGDGHSRRQPDLAVDASDETRRDRRC